MTYTLVIIALWGWPMQGTPMSGTSTTVAGFPTEVACMNAGSALGKQHEAMAIKVKVQLTWQSSCVPVGVPDDVAAMVRDGVPICGSKEDVDPTWVCRPRDAAVKP